MAVCPAPSSSRALVLIIASHIHLYQFGVFVDLPFSHWTGLGIAPTFGPFFDTT